MLDSDQGNGGDSPVFRLALSMSGAISAGAYTAGVFDFLLFALDEWEKRRGNTGHRTIITAMSGASAGGIVSALGPMALGHGLECKPYQTAWGGTINCHLPDLYEAWVVKPDMLPPAPKEPGLLTTEDLKSGPLRGLLNGAVLDAVCKYVLRPAPVRGAEYPYIARDLHIYLTISNLAGIPYSIRSANDDPYCMVSHADRLHYVVEDLGAMAGLSSLWAARDTITRGAPLQVRHLSEPSEDWISLGASALATSAFPVGLSPQLVRATFSDYDGQDPSRTRQWPASVSPGADIVPGPAGVWPARTETGLGFVSVDGGMINNDPFDYARYCLLDDRSPEPLGHNERKPECADRAVIMISPFPEGQKPGDLQAGPDGISLIAAVKRLLPALIDQARFKMTDLATAADENVASRWLISPRRTPNGATSSDYIACGLLGGFGGFLHRSFREHDFQLGQRNCQQFLRNWFALPAENPLVLKAAEHTVPSDVGMRKQGLRRIIPLVGGALPEIGEPRWPQIGDAELGRLMGGIRKRSFAVFTHLSPSIIWRSLAWCLGGPIFLLAWWLYLYWTVRRTLRAALVLRGQWR